MIYDKSLDIEGTVMEQIIAWFTEYGYWILFVGLFLEFLFLPFPGGFVMAVSGILSHQGELDFWLCVLLAVSGTTLGMSMTYFIGRLVGWPFIEKHGHRIFMGEKRRQSAQKWFNRFGSKVVFISFFIPGVRHFTGYTSGLMQLRFRVFFFYVVTGALLWVLTFVSLGYFLGERWEELVYLFKIFGLPAIGLGIVIFIIYLYRKRSINEEA